MNISKSRIISWNLFSKYWIQCLENVFSLRTRDKKAHILPVDQRRWTNCNHCMYIVSRNKFFDTKYLSCHMISKETIRRHFHNENTTLWASVYFGHNDVKLIMLLILSVLMSLFQLWSYPITQYIHIWKIWMIYFYFNLVIS